MVDQVDLSRYELTGRLGTGADYEVRSGIDRETGQQVAIKRPMPQAISRRQHENIEARTARIVQVYEEIGRQTELIPPILGYTERAAHDGFFGDELGETYTVLAQGRAAGIPLLGDMMSRITGVPIAAGQNLFALFPLVENRSAPKFPIHNQLLELQQVHLEAGYVLLDLRPQNIFFQPGSAKITVIDTGALAGPGSEAPRGRPPYDVNDACLELVKFYTTPEEPPREAHGYRDARGIRPIVSWREEVQDLDRNLSQAGGGVEASGRVILERLKDRSYSDCDQFKQDVNTYLDEVLSRDRSLTGFASAQEAWTEALGWLKEEYWTRFLFDPEAELGAYAA